MFLVRVFLVWLLIIFAESVHGTLRQLFLAPLVGDLTARRIAFFVGLGLIFAIALLTIRWIAAPSRRALVAAGAVWTVLTALFEIALGRLVMDLSWERIGEDYDITRGGLMGLGLLILLFVPMLAARLRR